VAWRKELRWRATWNAEPLPCGDRQIAKRVAKEHNPLQRLRFEVSLS
jgi:hypothetical protein